MYIYIGLYIYNMCIYCIYICNYWEKRYNMTVPILYHVLESSLYFGSTRTPKALQLMVLPASRQAGLSSLSTWVYLQTGHKMATKSMGIPGS